MSGHTARVKSVNKLAKKNQKKFLEPQLLDPHRYERERTSEKNGPGRYNIASGMVGHWVEPDSRDTKMAIKSQLAKDDRQMGQVMATDEDVEYIKSKKDQEYYWSSLRLGQYLIDPERPETQDHAFAVLPELKDYPDQYHRDNLAIQEALRTMLRDGKLGGLEDHELIMKIIRPDFELPIFPVWDPKGLVLTGEADLRTAFQAYLDSGIESAVDRGFFSPRQWGVDTQQEASALQEKLKFMILRRLYPGLRDKKDYELKQFMRQISPAAVNTQEVAEYSLNNNPLGFFNTMLPDHFKRPGIDNL
jgi:hypothetical protein